MPANRETFDRWLKLGREWLKDNWRFLISVAVVGGLFWLPASGHPLLAWLALLGGALWFVPRLHRGNSRGRLLSESFRCVQGALLVAIVTLGISQLLSVIQSASDATRHLGASSEATKVGLVVAGFAFVFWASPEAT